MRRRQNYDYYQLGPRAPPAPPWIRIIFEGFAVGMLAGFTVKTGIKADPFSLMYNVTEITVKTMEQIEPKKDYSQYLIWAAIACAIAAIVAIIEIITQVDDWKFGAALFGFGFVIGFIVLIAFIKI